MDFQYIYDMAEDEDDDNDDIDDNLDLTNNSSSPKKQQYKHKHKDHQERDNYQHRSMDNDRHQQPYQPNQSYKPNHLPQSNQHRSMDGKQQQQQEQQHYLNPKPTKSNNKINDPSNTYTSQILNSLETMAYKDLELGNINKSLDGFRKCFEHVITLNDTGIDNIIFEEYFKGIIMNLNEKALALLKQDQVNQSMNILERCIEYYVEYENHYNILLPDIKNTTYNHLACCYRRLGKLNQAIYYLQKALQFIMGLDLLELSGITYINLCAIYSQIGNHKEALEYAKKAALDCSFDLISAKKDKELVEDNVKQGKKATMLAIACHNLAIELEFCGEDEVALQEYKKAYMTIEECNGKEDKLAIKFKEAYEKALDKNVQKQIRNSLTLAAKVKKSKPKIAKKLNMTNTISNSGIYNPIIKNKTLKMFENNPYSKPISSNFYTNATTVTVMGTTPTTGASGTRKTFFVDKRILFPHKNIIPVQSSATKQNNRQLLYVALPEKLTNFTKSNNTNQPQKRPHSAIPAHKSMEKEKMNIKKEVEMKRSLQTVEHNMKKDKLDEDKEDSLGEIEKIEGMLNDESLEEEIDEDHYKANRLAFLKVLNQSKMKNKPIEPNPKSDHEMFLIPTSSDDDDEVIDDDIADDYDKPDQDNESSNHSSSANTLDELYDPVDTHDNKANKANKANETNKAYKANEANKAGKANEANKTSKANEVSKKNEINKANEAYKANTRANPKQEIKGIKGVFHENKGGDEAYDTYMNDRIESSIGHGLNNSQDKGKGKGKVKKKPNSRSSSSLSSSSSSSLAKAKYKAKVKEPKRHKSIQEKEDGKKVKNERGSKVNSVIAEDLLMKIQKKK